eukprot:366438-Chlamydomonas_euryale.AAC.10
MRSGDTAAARLGEASGATTCLFRRTACAVRDRDHWRCMGGPAHDMSSAAPHHHPPLCAQHRATSSESPPRVPPSALRPGCAWPFPVPPRKTLLFAILAPTLSCFATGLMELMRAWQYPSRSVRLVRKAVVPPPRQFLPQLHSATVMRPSMCQPRTLT